ncbi:hypothetical protein NEOLEDRAFT_1126157 [Neolentinus lepideus HHB14362 ss-1]|uniref:Rad21/Rec8-like protein N-terminal domain-containing protein n=1 Tax=Neolentinus lepideus HHB14362 ss-1 TaxID=1314782 RepID=A0A165W2F8_9AGAM|nr:hypothetical protein NEOLEDRAFT_1126157 [Neolentinus lepideus HHB14362 ss-1]
MFFSTELLSRRDSGFGLLWLAATLGSKSSFKKLPKRSVLTADIAQLCGLIVEPAEPLALRLSSNLMVGVVRVYKVKQEIFLSDVTTCFHSLKKAVQDFQSMTLSDAQLQMGQPTVRSDAVTLQADPGAEFAMNFDHFFAEWDDFLEQNGQDADQDDDEYGKSRGKSKRKNKQQSMSIAEDARAIPHTLDENLEQLLSTSFDASFAGSAFVGADPSSSQMNGEFGFALDDNPFGGPDDLDLGIADELAQELGEGWGIPSQNQAQDAQMNLDANMNSNPALDDMDFGDFAPNMDEPAAGLIVPEDDGMNNAFIEHVAPFDQGADAGPISPHAFEMTPRLVDSPGVLPKEAMDGEDVGGDLEDLPTGPKRPKRTRLVMDARTELTDEELQNARTNYLQGQTVLKNELELKKFERDGIKIIEEMICGVPRAFMAESLMDFWSHTLKVQMDSRFRVPDLTEDEPPMKRQRTSKAGLDDNNAKERQDDMPGFDFNNGDNDMQFGANVDFLMDIDNNMGFMQQYGADPNAGLEPGLIRSSEEPDIARRASRPPSGLGSYLGAGAGDAPIGSSQKSSLFPWDNAGPSSSVAGGPFSSARFGSDRASVDQADIRLRRSRSGSRRGSSLVPNRMGSVLGDVGMSPMLGDAFLGKDDDFVFDLSADDKAPIEDSQISEMNLVTLERNSHNFLEYTKMQIQTLPHRSDSLTFDDVVLKDTSTPHVAAAAFYHCLVLATKDLLRLNQDTPYGSIQLSVK